MRGRIRTLGILVGILIVSAGLFALFFWLDWKHEKDLFDQARRSYHDGNPTEALALYQELLGRKGLSEAQQREAQDQADELAAYLDALSLQSEGSVEEAINAYESYLEEHRICSLPENYYCSFTRQALAVLRPELARIHQQNGNHAQAVETYLSLLSMTLVGESECGPTFPEDDRGLACLEADTAVENGHDIAETEIPLVLLSWAETAEREQTHQEAIDWFEGAFEEFATMSTDEGVMETLAQLYFSWASNLRELEKYPDAIDKYQIIIGRYSETDVSAMARTALDEVRQEYAAWLEVNPAIPVLEFPTEVSRDAEGHWAWTTEFKETSGKVGYTLTGMGWIETESGDRYGPWGGDVNRGTVTVLAGGRAEDSYWVSGDTFEGGSSIITWTGEDEGGHSIEIVETIHLLP